MAHSADRLVGSMDTVTDGRARPAESGVLVPRRCTLDGFSAEVARTGGVYLRDLDPITNLRVQTENTLYEITVPRPPRSVVLDWDRAGEGEEPVEYVVYEDKSGKKVHSGSTATVARIEDLEPDTYYTFSVKPVAEGGNEGAPATTLPSASW